MGVTCPCNAVAGTLALVRHQDWIQLALVVVYTRRCNKAITAMQPNGQHAVQEERHWAHHLTASNQVLDQKRADSCWRGACVKQLQGPTHAVIRA